MKEPCVDCKKKYHCDEQKLACGEFRFFVNTGYRSVSQTRFPSREIYVEIFNTPPSMTPTKTRIRDRQKEKQ